MDTRLMTYQSLKDGREALENIFDKIRMIEPAKKEVLPMSLSCAEDTAAHCFEFWGRNKICDNCIAMRALNHKSSLFKLETRQERIFLVIAQPVQMDGSIAVIELIKDVSDSLTVEDLEIGDNKLIDMVSNINRLEVRDALTGLYNRRYIDERLPADIFNSHAKNTPLTVIMADIDRFKLVNDSFGHVAGDAVLKQFGNLLEGNIPQNKGWVGRYGGEEFLIALPDTDKSEAESIAEKIRANVEKNEFIYSDQIIRITSSFGAITLTPVSSTTTEAVIESADRNLYRAKSSGRNKVVAE